MDEAPKDKASKNEAPKNTPKDSTSEGGPRASLARRLLLGVGPFALAATMIFYVMAGPRLGPTGPELPPYALTTSVGEKVDVTGRLHLGSAPQLLGNPRRGPERSGEFEILLTPATPPVGKIVAYGFTLSGDRVEPLDAKIEVLATGVVRLRGAVRRAFDQSSELRIVVGSPNAIGRFDDALERARNKASDREVRVFVVAIDRDA